MSLDSHNQPESLEDIFHKEKEAKRKLKTKGLSPIVPMDNRTIGLGYHSRQELNAPEVEGLQDNRLARTRNQLKNFEIDEYLYQLVSEGMIDEKFIPFYAKACHVLGINTINRLKVNAYNGNDKQKLFAYKVKGAMQLHFKREFEREP
ncbi:MAG: hypothetical protein E6R04_10080 [Spirochaetes bacterium]|nr:MAG: hypothetical protein E6R04_10080 [Spirochaetota bacterium]